MFRINKNNEVDPISEAEIYFSYQRDDKAIEILKSIYATANVELKDRIHECLFKNNKMDLFKKALPTVGTNKSENPIKNYKYRVHFTSYIEQYSNAHKVTITCENPKNSSLGLEEIERFINEYKSINKYKNDWVINFISDELQ